MIILTFILNFFGIILVILVWLVVRSPISGETKLSPFGRRCSNCGRTIPRDAKVCPYCVKKIRSIFINTLHETFYYMVFM